MSNGQIEETGFDDLSVRVFEIELFKGRKGYTDRVGFPLLGKGKDGELVPFTLKARVHYNSETGTFLCLSSGDEQADCCKRLGSPGLRFGTILVQYLTDKNGTLKKPGGYDLKFWFFSDKKFDKLRSVNSEYSLAQKDLKISCTNQEFQHLDMMPCKEAVWQLKESLKVKIQEDAEKLKPQLKKMLARNKTLEQVREDLGISSGGSGQIDESDLEDYSDVLSEIGD